MLPNDFGCLSTRLVLGTLHSRVYTKLRSCLRIRLLLCVRCNKLQDVALAVFRRRGVREKMATRTENFFNKISSSSMVKLLLLLVPFLHIPMPCCTWRIHENELLPPLRFRIQSELIFREKREIFTSRFAFRKRKTAMEKLFPYRVRKRASGWRKAKGIIDGIFTMEMKTLWYGLWGSTDSIKLRKVDCAWNMRGERDWASIRTGNNGIQIFEWFMMRCWARFFSASPRKPGGNKSFAFTAARRNEAFVCAKPIASSRGASVEKFNQIKCFINHSALLPSPRYNARHLYRKNLLRHVVLIPFEVEAWRDLATRHWNLVSRDYDHQKIGSVIPMPLRVSWKVQPASPSSYLLRHKFSPVNFDNRALCTTTEEGKSCRRVIK